ncbi:putative membrane protein [Pseudorhizobium tarimense]|uniref:Membrane protein n=1 Tax=Pseudorhizobium tarimense TaxID=1079109 RepID=A0ABV2H669_9HYPH|nr:DUF2339 domain-containing protein [Pseudorhizobium tarimense]MCJ8519119.1 DUF2339 domain-containing protein [Pseudorhizobium tarimense]
MDLLLLIVIVLAVVWQRKTSQRLARIEDELAALKAGIVAAPPAAPEAEEPLIAHASSSAQRDGQDLEQVPLPVDAAAREVTAAQEDAAPAAKQPPRETFESSFGARWTVWIGGIALALGGIFLIRYTIESGLLGPAARLALASIFGVALFAAGELVRRRALPKISERYSNAMIPGALVAAGAVTLLGTIYAAHANYGFIGPALAFGLLGLVSLATLGVSLLHGQALAGLGLIASLVTPALVATTAPDATVLFGFLAIVWLASALASRIRGWLRLPALADLGLACWAIVYLFNTEGADPLPPVFALLVMIAGTGFVWPGTAIGHLDDVGAGWRRRLLRRRPMGLGIAVSVATLLPAMAMLAVWDTQAVDAAFAAAALIAALAALGAGRRYAVWPTLLSAVGAVAVVTLIAMTRLNYAPAEAGLSGPLYAFTAEILISLLLGSIYILLGLVFLKHHGRNEENLGAVWAVLMSAVPVTLAIISFLNFGLLTFDWRHGTYGIALGAVLLAAALWQFRKASTEEKDRPANLLVLGSFVALAFALHPLTSGLTTTILLAFLGFAYAVAARWRRWPALPWAMNFALLLIFLRIAWDPTLVGPAELGTVPFWNALLPGYGIPALIAVVAAYDLRRWPGLRARNLLQALASLMPLLAVAILARHAMNGGVLDDRLPSLGEQSIYTLLTIGFSATLMTLDRRAPSRVFRYGSMIAGVIATFNVLSMHIFVLNPYFSGEGTGSWPIVNLLLIGYLLPALAYGGLAIYARDKRPNPYVMMLALGGAVLGFLWATLSVRRFWQGENIADWKGFLANETYTYSVVWLLIGVALLALGSRLHARSLRLASAILVMVTVLKVFLIDMSNLEGILRALSFIGLGAVLIGIGLFYQKILARPSPQTVQALPEQRTKP